jgi:hypothetical protein
VEGAPANGLFGISCSSVSFCAIAATEGRILTSSDPFVAPPPTPKTSGKDGNGKRRHRKVGPKRPRTKIARAPLAGIETRSKKVRARTFFYPRHHVHVSGFLCRLDGGAPKRCRSPKSYLVGLGRHVVRIRAIGRTGLQGPAAVARFKVCRPHSSGFCLGTPIARTRGRGGGERQDSDLRPPA